MENLTKHEWYLFVQDARNELLEKDRQISSAVADAVGTVRYRWDIESGLLAWSRGGATIAMADILLAGTLSKLEKTWLWSWANTIIPLLARQGVDQVYDFGRQHNVEKLWRPEWPADEDDARDMVSVACKLLKGRGAFRDENDHVSMWFVIKDVKPVSVVG